MMLGSGGWIRDRVPGNGGKVCMYRMSAGEILYLGMAVVD